MTSAGKGTAGLPGFVDMSSMHTFCEHGPLEWLAACRQDCTVAVEAFTVSCDDPNIAELRFVEERADTC